ncbi:crossover junction endodeoxyribonuclease RuvC [Patescibacteria group bacterium]
MTILGIDPGIARCGWAIITINRGIITNPLAGCIETPKEDLIQERLITLYDEIESLIKKHQPEVVSIEDLFMAANTKTAITVGQARGVVILAAGKNNLPVVSYTPLVIKQTITGWGRADKKQVQIMTQKILKLPELPKSDDAADALGVAITHAFSYKLKAKTL